MTRPLIGAIAALTVGLCPPAEAASAASRQVTAAEASARLRLLLSLDRRVNEVGYRLLAASGDLCVPRRRLTGAVLHSPGDYGPRLRPAFTAPANARLVAVIAPGSPAAIAGLREGDEVREVRPAGRESPGQDGAWVWTVSRAGRSLTMELHPRAACAEPPKVATSQAFKASASEGGGIRISSQLVEFARTDDELAVVLGHELAHLLLRQAGKAPRSSRERERRADELGLYLAARAGYDISSAPPFLARLAKAYGPLLIFDTRHPAPRARAADLEKVIEAIRARQATGAPLLPPDW